MAIFQNNSHHFDCICDCSEWRFAGNNLHFAVNQVYPSTIFPINRLRHQSRCCGRNPLVFNSNLLITMNTENLVYVANLGNGIFVCDKNRPQFGYYVAVAHIDYHRKVKFYEDNLPSNAKAEIENLALSGNMATSVYNPDKYALCPVKVFTD